MLNKRNAPTDDNEIHELDEGWWASVLSDEDAYSAQSRPVTPKPTPSTQLIVNWDRVTSIYENDDVVELDVTGYNRGGILVQGPDIQGFVPISHLLNVPCGSGEEQRRQALANYVGKIIKLKVIECEPADERIVLSERAALAGEGRRKQLFQALKPGEVVHGTVTNVTDFGVFVDLGGVEGLIHVSELSWGRVQHPLEVLKVGDCVDAMVLMISEENGRVALSLKRMHSNPWDILVRRYQPGDVVPAVVTTIKRFGVFARLQEGVEGLIHISMINLNGNGGIDNVLAEGQTIQVRILHVDAERRRLGLGLVSSD